MLREQSSHIVLCREVGLRDGGDFSAVHPAGGGGQPLGAEPAGAAEMAALPLQMTGTASERELPISSTLHVHFMLASVNSSSAHLSANVLCSQMGAAGPPKRHFSPRFQHRHKKVQVIRHYFAP